MAGERSAYFVEMAQRGAQRVFERISMIADRYGTPPKDDDVITFVELMQEYENFGHYPPGDGCTGPVCERARRMVANALRVVAAQQQQGAGGAF